MSPSLFKTVGSVAVAYAAGASAAYSKSEVYDSTNFFDKFDFFESKLNTGVVEDVDPTRGYVQYQSRTNAEALGLVAYQGTEMYIGPDHATTYDATGYGRKSVRMESKAVYNHGLVIADFTHLPKPTCGVWPSFWMFGTPWPTKGEIDIVENWNDLEFNRNTAHTGSPEEVGSCSISANMTGTVTHSNCYDPIDNIGCSAQDADGVFGSGLGGIYAMEWTSEHLAVWNWARTAAPADIAAGKPTPSTWGTPSYMIHDCDIERAFQDMNIVLNIDFCGVAGDPGQWDSCAVKTGYSTCQAYVAANHDDFQDAHFKIKDITIYTEGENVPTSSSTVISITTSSASSSSSTSSSSVISTPSSTASSTSSTSSTSSIVSSSTSTSFPTFTSSGHMNMTTPTSSSGSTSFPTLTSSGYQNTTTSTASATATSTSTDEEEDDGPPETDYPTYPTFTSSGYFNSSTNAYPTATASGYFNSSTNAYPTATPSGYFNSSTPAYPTSTPTGDEEDDCPADETETDSYPTETPSGYPTSSGVDMTTSTAYTTIVETVTSCAPTVTDCPANSGTPYVTTKTVALYTTVCPVSETAESVTPTAPVTVSYITSTAYVTKTYTITSCAPTVTNCPVGKVTTSVATSTTVYPTVQKVDSSTRQELTTTSTITVDLTSTVYVKPPHSTSMSEYVPISSPTFSEAAESASDVVYNFVTAIVVPVATSSATPKYTNATMAASVSEPVGTGAVVGCQGAECYTNGAIRRSANVASAALALVAGVAVFAL